eukprot:TRINITY_DN5260_c0_g1_i1.p1 TRINITY_DN5260_c0_g1~~TRINITY_DN5260_c0_g1_i1.p1  ORF type:complete len:95 (+),score=9.40 TRINITY_DN5260_c0_g1_i1:162-446(+)
MAESQNEQAILVMVIFVALLGFWINHYEFFPSIFPILPDEIKPIFEKIQIPKKENQSRASSREFGSQRGNGGRNQKACSDHSYSTFRREILSSL